MQGLNDTGRDLSPEHITNAIHAFGDKDRFIVGYETQDVEALSPPSDLVMFSALIHDLDDDEAQVLVSQPVSLTKLGGRILTTDSIIWLFYQKRIA